MHSNPHRSETVARVGVMIARLAANQSTKAMAVDFCGRPPGLNLSFAPSFTADDDTIGKLSMQTYLDPQHVPETLAIGSCNAHVVGNLMIITFTANIDRYIGM
jgi:hypothetical protein